MLAAFDLATRVGWCCGAGDVLPGVGSYLLDGDQDWGRYFLQFDRWLGAFMGDRRPSVVAFELPVLAKFTTISATTKLQGLSAILQLNCARAGTPCYGFTIQEGRKALTGRANAKKPDETVPAAKGWGLTIKHHDEADAFGVWLAAIRLYRPEHVARWEPLFAGAAAA